MKKSILKDVIVFLVMLAVVAVVCWFLPDSIPDHFNAQGEPVLDMTEELDVKEEYGSVKTLLTVI